MYNSKYITGIMSPARLFEHAANSVGYFEVKSPDKLNVTRAQQVISNRAMMTKTKIKQSRLSTVNELFEPVVLIKVVVLTPPIE